MHNEEFLDFVSSSNNIKMITSRRLKLAGHVVCLWEKRHTHIVMIGKHERLLGKPRHRWENNIIVDLKEIG